VYSTNLSRYARLREIRNPKSEARKKFESLKDPMSDTHHRPGFRHSFHSCLFRISCFVLRALIAPAFCASLAVCGCTQEDGSGRYALEGAVTLANGQPVPAGEIGFEPDSASGNSGPASLCQIKDGKYSLPKDQGIIGGKYIVNIIPFDGVAIPESPQGKPLRNFPFSEKVDFPAQDSTRDFKLPN